MVSLLAKIFIKEKPDSESESSRQGYGVLCGVVGILMNLLLFGIKLFAGIISGSIAITADAFNNLSDAGSSIITIFGFRLAAAKPDLDHPFGHGRAEYLSGLLVSAIIIVVGAELGISSVRGILSPENPEFSWLIVGILLASIAVKLYIAAYNRKYAGLLKSAALNATAADSLNDCISTGTVLLSMLIFKFFALNIDAYCGLLVAAFIIFSGLKSAKETLDPLLGAPADREFCKKVYDIVTADSRIVGIHDLIVHDYGPGRRMLSVHAEVPSDGDINEMHDLIDNIEVELKQKLSCVAVIHMDPVATDDETVEYSRRIISKAIKLIDPDCSLHDLRIVTGPTHTNVIFDLVLPFSVKLSDEEAIKRVKAFVSEMHPEYNCVITVDRSYVQHFGDEV